MFHICETLLGTELWAIFRLPSELPICAHSPPIMGEQLKWAGNSGGGLVVVRWAEERRGEKAWFLVLLSRSIFAFLQRRATTVKQNIL